MRVTPTITLGPDWIARNPSTGILSYSGAAIANHAVTSRASYTVPANKLLKVMGGSGKIWQQTAGEVSSKQILIGNADTTGGLDAYEQMIVKGPADLYRENLHMFHGEEVLVEGEELRIFTFSNDTVGTVTFLVNISYLLLDV